LRDAADRLLDFEDVVRSARVSDRFKKANALFKGLAVPLIEEIFRVPVFIQKIFSVSEPTGQHSLNLVFALPHGWVEDMHDAFEHAKRWQA